MTEHSTSAPAQPGHDPSWSRGVWPAELESVAVALQRLLNATAGVSRDLRHLSLVHFDVNGAEPLVTTSGLAIGMARAELRARSGPVFESLETGLSVIVTARERACRFPVVAHREDGQDSASQMAIPVWSHGRPAGALSVYWTEAAEVDPSVLTMAEALAAQATELLGLRRQVVNLDAAMRSREVIGQACGVLMNRYRLTEDQAMTALRLASQLRSTKLRELAAEVAECGTLVELD